MVPRIHLYALEVAKEHGFTFGAVQMPRRRTRTGWARSLGV